MNQHFSESESKKNFEELISQELGQFGKYQIFNLLLLMLPTTICGFMAGDYIFTAAKLPHRCIVPCDGPEPKFAPEWIHVAVPETATGINECYRYANTSIVDEPTGDYCPEHIFDYNRTVPCESYVFERTNSVVYEFGLECKEWLRALAGTLNSLGGMFALPLAGYISDSFGRRISVVIFSFNMALVGFIRSFSVNYSLYVTLQFLQTAIGGGAYSASYILATEIVGPKFRVFTSATMSSMFALGQALLGLIALLVTEWRTLSLVLFTPVFLLVSYYWILTESYRWLLSKGKNDQAKIILEHAARLNMKIISEKSMNELLTVIPHNAMKNETNEKSIFMRVIKSPVLLRRCCTTPVWWITTTFIYYGLSINSVSLSGNMYVNYIATSVVEIPGYWIAVLVLEKLGRKVTLFSGYMLCGICCIAFAFAPRNLYILSLLLYLTGKFCIALVFTSLYLYTTELYPTRYRHSFLGFSSMIGRIGSVLAPLTPPLMVYWNGIPSMLFGVMAIISASLILTQPETFGLKLPDTIEDAEHLGDLKGP